MVLVLKTVRDHWRAFFFWTLGLIAMVAMTLSVYPTVHSSSAGFTKFIENYPKALREIFRMEDFTSGSGYLSTELFSLMLPLIFISIGASWGSNATAREEELRTADILLTLPISRARILCAKIAAAISAQIFLALLLFAGLVLGIRFVGLSLSTMDLFAGALTVVLLGILFNSIATFFGAVLGKKSTALGGTIGMAIAGFLFYSLAPLVKTFDRITPMNPFRWTLGSRPLYDGVDLRRTVWSLLLSLVFYTASILVFKRRDIQA